MRPQLADACGVARRPPAPASWARAVLVRSWLVALALSLCRCSFEPSYERPTAPIPARWAGAAVSGQASEPRTVQPSTVDWRKLFQDPHLTAVVHKALVNNRDLRVATASILTARAEYALARANVLPRVALNADVYVRGNLAGNVAQQHALQLGTTDFELDVFGRLRSLSHAALERYLASQAGARAVRLSLIAGAASAWLTVSAQRSLLTIAEQTEQNARESVNVTQSRFAGGVASELDVRQAETVLAQARSDVATYTTTLAQARNALMLLAGSEIDPADLPDELTDDTGLLREIPAGIQSSVLLARPDVLEAEHNLRAANANIGAARAAFFPRISLTALGGLVSAALSALVSTSAAGVGVTLAPSASLPIFTGGANEAQLAYAKAQRQLYLAHYERVIQRAFREVADALARRSTIDAQLAAQRALLTASTASYQLSDARYRAGADSYLNALDAQRTLYSARRTLVLTQLNRADNLVTLYRVLGGS